MITTPNVHVRFEFEPDDVLHVADHITKEGRNGVAVFASWDQGPSLIYLPEHLPYLEALVERLKRIATVSRESRQGKSGRAT